MDISPRSNVRFVDRLRDCNQVPRYSMCTMVTSWEDYEACRTGFVASGFDDEVAEYLVVDNSKANIADAYQSLNAFLLEAKGEYVVIFHHDVRLLFDDRNKLDHILEDLEQTDNQWAVCGNAGMRACGTPVYNLSHPYNDNHREGGLLPAQVQTLDENFLVVKRAANLALSANLHGFHHYGADLCLVAQFLGWNCYVIDFFLRHDSPGTINKTYFTSFALFQDKYQKALKGRWVHLVTRESAYLSGLPAKITRLSTPYRRVLKLLGVVPRVGRSDR